MLGVPSFRLHLAQGRRESFMSYRGCWVPHPCARNWRKGGKGRLYVVPRMLGAPSLRLHLAQGWVGKDYAVARCSCPPSRTLTSFDTPGSCMVTP
jgi:hypothetical protein